MLNYSWYYRGSWSTRSQHRVSAGVHSDLPSHGSSPGGSLLLQSKTGAALGRLAGLCPPCPLHHLPAAHPYGHPGCQISPPLKLLIATSCTQQPSLKSRKNTAFTQPNAAQKGVAPWEQNGASAPVPTGQAGARGLQGEGSCFFSSFTKCLQGSYTKDPSTANPSPVPPSSAWSPPKPAGAKSLTGHQLPQPRCRVRNLPNSPPHPTWPQCEQLVGLGSG